MLSLINADFIRKRVSEFFSPIRPKFHAAQGAEEGEKRGGGFKRAMLLRVRSQGRSQ